MENGNALFSLLQRGLMEVFSFEKWWGFKENLFLKRRRYSKFIQRGISLRCFENEGNGFICWINLYFYICINFILMASIVWFSFQFYESNFIIYIFEMYLSNTWIYFFAYQYFLFYLILYVFKNFYIFLATFLFWIFLVVFILMMAF